MSLAGRSNDHIDHVVSPPRGRSRVRPPLQPQRPVTASPQPSPLPSRAGSDNALYRTTSLETRSRSPSPHLSPSLSHAEYYGSVNLTDRSRSPSPGGSAAGGAEQRTAKTKRSTRRLPATPLKPSTLNLRRPDGQSPGRPDAIPVTMPHLLPSPTVPQKARSPSSINFPHLNASPTRGAAPAPDAGWTPRQQRRRQPRSRQPEAPAAGAATARQLPNGYKPTGSTPTARTRPPAPPSTPLRDPSESDEDDDWC